MGLLVNLEGRTFGRLKVIGRIGSNDHKCATWECLCECGAHKTLSSGCLRSGNTKSCGCLRADLDKIRKTGVTPRMPEKSVWQAMITRCTSPRSKDFKYYGGRGIGVCERWLSFELFLKDMGYRPTALHMIERRDNDNGYCMENCYWATRAQQVNNRRSNRWITFDGQTKTLTQWAALLGINAASLAERLERGWSISAALTTRRAK